MAIARGAGTEIIRSIHLEGITDSENKLIYGVQHHIYTVLSIVVEVQAVATAGNYVRCVLEGYDSKGGTTAQDIYIFQQNMQVNETFVYNDKFSFNGHEPTDFAGPMDSVVKQDAIADQGSSVAQVLWITTQNGSDNMDVTCTYIDQNNA